MCQERTRESTMKERTVTTQVVKMTKVNESRKIRKPLMEKRRRARINDCLNELKRMLLDADAELKHPGSRPAKLEKADILELTVRHVRRLQRQERNEEDSSASAKFRAGFSECAREVRTELSRLETCDDALRERLSSHLSTCLSGLRTSDLPEEVSSSSTDTNSPPPPSSHTVVQRNGSRGFTLLPTKLPNGDLAFVIPAQLSAKTDDIDSECEVQSTQCNADPLWRPW